MPVYKVHVILDVEYDDIEADSEEEAFVIASDYAMMGGSWEYTVTQYEVDETQKNPCDDCQEFDCYGCEYAEWKEE